MFRRKAAGLVRDASLVRLHATGEIHNWFRDEVCRITKTDPPPKDKYQYSDVMPFYRVLDLASRLSPMQAELLMLQAIVKDAFPALGSRSNYSNHDRQAIAEFLDIDFKNFQVSDEWLQKKTKGELVRFIAHESGLPDDPAFQQYIGRYKLTLEKLAGLKKPALIQIITECGADLR